MARKKLSAESYCWTKTMISPIEIIQKHDDEKTFTKGGCKFCPSNMLGQGRKFDEEKFREKTVKLVFCIVSNIAFPRIKIRFVRGADLIKLYPRGEIPLKDHVKFFD